MTIKYNDKKATIMTNLKGLVALQTFISGAVVDVSQEHRVHLHWNGDSTRQENEDVVKLSVRNIKFI